MNLATLVTGAELAQRQARGNVLVADCRFDLADAGKGEREHAQAHIPGAVYFHLDRDLSDLGKRGLGSFDSLREQKWVDLQPDFDDAHFINGFGHADKKFHFRPNWTGQSAPNRPPKSMGLFGPIERLPERVLVHARQVRGRGQPPPALRQPRVVRREVALLDRGDEGADAVLDELLQLEGCNL